MQSCFDSEQPLCMLQNLNFNICKIKLKWRGWSEACAILAVSHFCSYTTLCSFPRGELLPFWEREANSLTCVCVLHFTTFSCETAEVWDCQITTRGRLVDLERRKVIFYDSMSVFLSVCLSVSLSYTHINTRKHSQTHVSIWYVQYISTLVFIHCLLQKQPLSIKIKHLLPNS